MKFFAGFVCGLLLKDKLSKLSIKLLTIGISEYYKYRPKKINKYVQKIYGIDLFVKGKTIKLDKEIVDYINDNFNNLDITIKTLCDLKDIPIIENTYVYIHYTDDLKHYTNVYSLNDQIKENDFYFSEKKIYSKYKNVICVLSGSEYVTANFKKYFNQPDNSVKLSPSIMFFNKDNLTLLNSKERMCIENLQVI